MTARDAPILHPLTATTVYEQLQDMPQVHYNTPTSPPTYPGNSTAPSYLHSDPYASTFRPPRGYPNGSDPSQDTGRNTACDARFNNGAYDSGLNGHQVPKSTKASQHWYGCGQQCSAAPPTDASSISNESKFSQQLIQTLTKQYSELLASKAASDSKYQMQLSTKDVDLRIATSDLAGANRTITRLKANLRELATSLPTMSRKEPPTISVGSTADGDYKWRNEIPLPGQDLSSVGEKPWGP